MVEPFRIHVADEVLDDLRARLRHTRWPDQIPGIGWKQGTDLDWLRRIVSYWADEFDWRAWEQRLNTLDHFTWEGIHFVYKQAASGRGMPLILTHGWPGSFLDYVDMLSICAGIKKASAEEQEKAIHEVFKMLLMFRSANRIEGKIISNDLEKRLSDVEKTLSSTTILVEQITGYLFKEKKKPAAGKKREG